MSNRHEAETGDEAGDDEQRGHGHERGDGGCVVGARRDCGRHRAEHHSGSVLWGRKRTTVAAAQSDHQAEDGRAEQQHSGALGGKRMKRPVEDDARDGEAVEDEDGGDGACREQRPWELRRQEVVAQPLQERHLAPPLVSASHRRRNDMMPRPCAHREPDQRRIVDAIGIRKRPFLAERDRDHRPSLARGVVQGPTSKLTRPVVGGVSVRTEEALGALGGPATDRGDEEVRRRNRKEQGHQGARGLHEVGGGVPGVSRRVCTEAGLGSGCGVRRGRRIDGSVGRGRAEREADASTNQRRHGESQIVPSGSGGIRGGHAASHPLRQQGGCV